MVGINGQIEKNRMICFNARKLMFSLTYQVSLAETKLRLRGCFCKKKSFWNSSQGFSPIITKSCQIFLCTNMLKLVKADFL